MATVRIQTHRDLDAWKKAMNLVESIYNLTHSLPDDEKFGLTAQMRRAVISIPSNIAEGYRRKNRPDYAKFIRYAFGSGSELETQIEITRRLRLIDTQKLVPVEELLQDVLKLLNGLASSLERR